MKTIGYSFQAELKIIGVNPYVDIPPQILDEIFVQAGKDKGPIPVCGKVNQQEFRQTLVKYAGEWRFYVNTIMLKNSPKRIGEVIHIEITFDKESRAIAIHPDLLKALNSNSEAQQVFEKLSPSLQKEIIRYIANLKSEESRERNIARAIQFLLGNERFIGRDKP
ncbi:YdeI/OmpD-associated family protein [Flectobacillus longus]|uniref:YdeI/OmpD-associated family protein n=1 Tax=Flectobacillus longus TaxID=2984207 RepID=UPI0024B7B848|nr:YdeI/OmpD-associated family protein [Flectobacillus longus]MDI9879604.1 YdeI/OmpD-associated family protein [Flectobacillus longus]